MLERLPVTPAWQLGGLLPDHSQAMGRTKVVIETTTPPTGSAS